MVGAVAKVAFVVQTQSSLSEAFYSCGLCKGFAYGADPYPIE